MGWIALWRLWRLDKHIAHLYNICHSIFGILESSWISYEMTTRNSNNELVCSVYVIIKQVTCNSLCCCFMVPGVCYAAAMFRPKFWCLYLKQLYIPHFYLKMREPQVINKAFVEIVRFKHYYSFTSISITSNRIWIQK